jgi:hypothetical protein
MTEGCGVEFVGPVVVEGFSKEANSASKSLSGEGCLGASLCVVVDTGVGIWNVSEYVGSATGAAVESDDHHQPMICYECVC